MSDQPSFTRRSVLKWSGGAVVAATLSGCTETATVYEVWGGVAQIVLECYTDGWRGVEPAIIEDVQNPTLVLYESHEYEITMRNGDGEAHSLEIRAGDQTVDSDYQTSLTDERGETETVAIEGVPWMTEYVCKVHSQTECGVVDVRPEGDTDTYEGE
ncbi:twin-arginine translocation signal domain-containing protein [Natrononativus amylolyticus]|uniref:twin-arginine translocation signal domain-containing protein n=1 Tax=Natrononativus amylolyticus TaxID=2963434 RepID=UPI0020CF7013|nr:twin-arginine translocation signal domain-containing protein [Natrononativus amylolyticus]